jgi:hypothetical protein
MIFDYYLLLIKMSLRRAEFMGRSERSLITYQPARFSITVIIDNNHSDSRSWVLQATPNTSVYGYGVSKTAPPIMVDVPLNQWKHIVLIRTPAKTILYADNVLIGSENCTRPINYDGSQRLSLGKYTWGGRYFCGKIDDVYIFNRALDEQEISALFKEKK